MKGKINIGVARSLKTGRWHIIAVREGETEKAHMHDDLAFDTKEEAMAELQRQLESLRRDYEIEFFQ